MALQRSLLSPQSFRNSQPRGDRWDATFLYRIHRDTVCRLQWTRKFHIIIAENIGATVIALSLLAGLWQWKGHKSQTLGVPSSSLHNTPNQSFTPSSELPQSIEWCFRSQFGFKARALWSSPMIFKRLLPKNTAMRRIIFSSHGAISPSKLKPGCAGGRTAWEIVQSCLKLPTGSHGFSKTSLLSLPAQGELLSPTLSDKYTWWQAI